MLVKVLNKDLRPPIQGGKPSFDGKIWRLHSGLYAEVVWEEPNAGWLNAQKEES